MNTFNNRHDLKILKKLYDITIDQLKSEFRKEEIITNNINKIKSKINLIDKKKNSKYNFFIKKYPYECKDCKRRFEEKTDLNTHKKKKFCDYSGVLNPNFNIYDINYLKYELDTSNKYLSKILNKIEYFYEKKKSLKDKINILSKKCNKCHKNNYLYFEELNCSNNHIICQDCLDLEETYNSCPVCFDIINIKKCPICMSFKSNMVNLNCKNPHPYQICIECVDSVLNSNGKCPFCREIM